MRITAFGEILWDNLPSGKVLGGAPLNVMVRMAQLGAQASIISACGNDNDGKALCAKVAEQRVYIDLIQRNNLPTSLVNVHLDAKGSATYDIVYPCAWDNIMPTQSALDEVKQADAFVFGSLASRDERSFQTLKALLAHAEYKIFDVNLRTPHYNYETLRYLMSEANLIKLNDEELFEITSEMGCKKRSLEQNIQFLSDKASGAKICVTLGAHGAVFYDTDEECFSYCAGYRVDVVDTVGAGDNFFGAFLWKYLQEPNGVESALEFGCAVGAMVAGQAGATPKISRQEIEQFMEVGIELFDEDE
ncbi:MAG: carbohydrate kinase [Cardiobacteriaceae bacterium]|nr:carbohydrate kinase [Cardiobacteriaceae bacterium]